MTCAPAFDPTEAFPWESSPSVHGASRQSAVSHGTHVDPVLQHPHHPFPDPVSGALVVDPDIHLRARGFDLDINLFYNSRSSYDGAYGKKRSISANCYIVDIPTDPTDQAMAVRGDEKAYQFTKGSTSMGITQYSCNNGMYSGTSLVFDSNVTAFIETFPDGKKITYGKNLGGANTRVALGGRSEVKKAA